MNETLKNVLISAVVSALIATGTTLLVGGQSADNLGGTRFPSGISADTTSPAEGEVRGTTLTSTGAATLGGDLTVTTSNSATSTLEVGCIETHATSTDTDIALTFNTVSTTTVANGQSADGHVTWQYGNCPF